MAQPAPQAKSKNNLAVKIGLDIVMALVLVLLYNGHVLLLTFHEAAGIKRNEDFWRDMHEFCSAVSIILVGIHLGLYWDMVKGFFKKLAGYGAVASRVFTVIPAAILVWDVICIPTAGVTEWLLAPVTENTYHGKDKGRGSDTTQTAEGEQIVDRAEGETAQDGQQSDGSQEGQSGSEEKNHSHGGKRTISIPNIFLVISQYSSIIAVFATITYVIDRTLRKRRRASKEH